MADNRRCSDCLHWKPPVIAGGPGTCGSPQSIHAGTRQPGWQGCVDFDDGHGPRYQANVRHCECEGVFCQCGASA